jgi:lipopolysaccharide biosynthesis glycosyltransferase
MPQPFSSAISPPPFTLGPAVSSPAAAQAATDPRQVGPTTAGCHVHVLLCTNALFLQHAAVCLVSLLSNNCDLFFDVVIAWRATEHLDEQKLRGSLAHFANYSLSFREFTPPAALPLPLNPRAHYTLDNWTRLWVAEFFTDDVDRVLYLDSDVVVVGSLAALWRTDLEGALLGAVDIPGSQHGIARLAMRAEDGYFNSGVLLIDLKQWRDTGALQVVLRYIAAYPRRMVFTLDQDALNACFHGRKRRLDYKWNVVCTFFEAQQSIPLTQAELEAVRREARIIHFNSNVKPWSYFCDHPRKAEYDKYLRMTEWRDFVPPDRTMINKLRKRLSAILSERTKRAIKALIP